MRQDGRETVLVSVYVAEIVELGAIANVSISEVEVVPAAELAVAEVVEVSAADAQHVMLRGAPHVGICWPENHSEMRVLLPAQFAQLLRRLQCDVETTLVAMLQLEALQALV